jgi:hypothetical protein
MSITLLLIIGALLGLGFGLGEASERAFRVRTNDPRTLPHTMLLWARIAATGICTVLVLSTAYVLEWITPPMAPLLLFLRHWLSSFLVLTLVHRLTFNLASQRPWYYLGSPNRTQDDSVYDNLMWTISALLFLWIKRWHDSIPFLLALLIEGTTLYFTLTPLLP